MGMMSCYQEADVALIESLKEKDAEDIFEEIEELQDSNTMEVYNMDKLWDGLHYLLTGVSATAPVGGNPLSEAIVGTKVFHEDADEFISYIYPERVKDILTALLAFDIERALKDFVPEVLAQKNIYPNIWRNVDTELLCQELSREFFGVKEFYEKMIAKETGVIVSIY